MSFVCGISSSTAKLLLRRSHLDYHYDYRKVSSSLMPVSSILTLSLKQHKPHILEIDVLHWIKAKE